MNPPSKSRRRLLISLGLLGLTGAFYPSVQKYLEIRNRTATWKAKWQRSTGNQDTADKTPPPASGSRVPALIEHDLTLTRADSPWIIDADVTIASGATLTIEAGNEILIGSKKYFIVKGRILARGDTENPIHFRAWSDADTDRWAGILLINTTTPSEFHRVTFENSNYGSRLVYAAAAWTSCSFRNVREVSSSFKSATTFKACLIEYKDYKGHGNINVFKFQKGPVHVEDCNIYCPDSNYKVDGIDADYIEQGVFRGNRMHGGICPGADAIDIGQGSRNILIENNIITDFVDKGVSVGEGADVTINNNVIARCAMGVGVKDSARAKISRTTFYGNDYGVKCYEKVAGRGGGHAELDSCIIADSKQAPFEIDSLSSISIANTLCNQQQLPGTGNLQGTPEFENIGSDRFNCTKITLTGSTSQTQQSCAAFGARILSLTAVPQN